MEILTRRQAAEFLKLSVSHLDKLRIQGKGPRYFKLGDSANGLVRYDKRELETWLEFKKI